MSLEVNVLGTAPHLRDLLLDKSYARRSLWLARFVGVDSGHS